MSQTQKRWLIALLYVGLIYATINVSWIPLRYLRLHGVLRLSLLLLTASSFVFLLIWMIKSGARDAWRYIVLVAVFACYGLIAPQLPRLEEQLHFLEYGLTGVLFARALESHRLFDGWVFVWAVVLAGLSGWGDELLQKLSPYRLYSLNDVGLNVVSAALGLTIYRAFPHKPSARRVINPPAS